MWTLTKVTRIAKSALMQSVEFTFTNDTDGMEHRYVEPNVSDVSDAGLANLARNQLRQLNLVASVPPGDGDVAAINALISPTQPGPPKIDPDAEKRAAYLADIQTRDKLLKLVPDDPEIAAINAKLDAALKDETERAILLSAFSVNALR